MAKTNIKADAIIITSDIKLDGLQTVAKYDKKKLILMGGDEGKEPVFAIGVAKSGSGSLNGCSAAFSPVSRENGFATITMMVPDDVKDAKEWLVDTYGRALMNLAALEKKLPEVITQLAADKKAVADSITVG